MKSSSTSSATASRAPIGSRPAPPREGFALTGPSVPLDPATHAVRRDLADVRLAAYVFAPHYAAPVACRLTRPVALRGAREPEAPEVGSLAAGDAFEVLDLVADCAWGMAPGIGKAGWIDRAALGAPA